MGHIPDSLFSQNLERQFIGGVLNFPNTIVDLSNILSDDLCYTREHKILLSVIKTMVFEGKKPEKVIIAERVKSLGLKMDIDIFDYLDAISNTTIQPRGIEDCAKELIRLKIRRDLWNNAASVQAYIKDSANDPIDKIISQVDVIYNNQLKLFTGEHEPVDLYGGIEDFIKEIAKNPVDEVGFRTPFPEWNRLFGGIRPKSTVNVVSRSGEGKSCFLFNMAKHICRLNNIKCLYIDTEMDLDLNMFRAAAAEMQLNAWYLETGQWIRNQELTQKVLKGFTELKQYQGSIHHIYLPNRPIKDTISLMKKWYFKNVGRGNKCLFVYDYLKITDTTEKNRAEYQLLGDMLNCLNELNHELDCSTLTAGQQNRAAENQGQRNDDSTTAAASDRINHLVALNGVFRMKTLDEISEQGADNGTHLFKPFKTSRVQGKDNYNLSKNKTVRIVDAAGKTKYKQNFLNFEIKEYGLYERGTYADIIKKQNLQAALQAHDHHNDTNVI